MSGLVLPADGATKPLQGQKMENFVESIYIDTLEDLQRAEEELRAEEERIVKFLSTGKDLLEMPDPENQEIGLGLIVAGCWMLQKKRERENEPSPPCSARENEPAGMGEKTNARAPNEPALRRLGREDEPPSRMKAMVRAQNEPTMLEEGRDDEPPEKSHGVANQPFLNGMTDRCGREKKP